MLVGLAGAAGADLLEPIAFALVLLPVCEAAIAAPHAADEEAAPVDHHPGRTRRSWREAARPVSPRVDPHAFAHPRGTLFGVALPLLS